MMKPVLVALALGLVLAACQFTVGRQEQPDNTYESADADLDTYSERPSRAIAGGHAAQRPAQFEARVDVEAMLDDWHLAASEADVERYFGHLAPGAIFLGTDANERWSREEFYAYAEPHFSAGKGWSYRPLERHVYFDETVSVAWFDERLWNEKYGECRGTGVAMRFGTVWRIVHYSLTFPVPNDLATQVIELIRRGGAEGADGE